MNVLICEAQVYDPAAEEPQTLFPVRTDLPSALASLAQMVQVRHVNWQASFSRRDFRLQDYEQESDALPLRASFTRRPEAPATLPSRLYFEGPAMGVWEDSTVQGDLVTYRTSQLSLAYRASLTPVPVVVIDSVESSLPAEGFALIASQEAARHILGWISKKMHALWFTQNVIDAWKESTFVCIGRA
jgi:hypothetical protein